MTPDPNKREAMKRCDCVFTLTDRDLPPIARSEANLWKAKFFEAWKELSKANKGLRRLRAKLDRAPERDAEVAAMRQIIEELSECLDDQMTHVRWSLTSAQSDEDSEQSLIYCADQRANKAREATVKTLASTAGAEILKRLKRAEEERDAARDEMAAALLGKVELKNQLASVTAEKEAETKAVLDCTRAMRLMQDEIASVTAERDALKLAIEQMKPIYEIGIKAFNK